MGGDGWDAQDFCNSGFGSGMTIKAPTTAAIRFLRREKIPYSEHLYDYEEHGGTAVSARELGVSEHHVIKTLVMEMADKSPIIVLMHGDKKVSTKNLARQIGTKSIAPCDPKVANKHSGYVVGGTSPFGTKKLMPIYVEESVFDLDKIYVNGGYRGFLVGIDPKVLSVALDVQSVSVATE